MNENQLRMLYIYKMLCELTDDEHYLTVNQIIRLLKERYEIEAYRTTVIKDIETLKLVGVNIEAVRATQNRYSLTAQVFEMPELKLLIDAVESSRFITDRKSRTLVVKLTTLASSYKAEELKRHLHTERRIRGNNEKIYYIIDAVNEAIDRKKKIRFQYVYYDMRKKKKLRHGGEWYLFSPYALVWNGDYYYMLGFSDKYGEITSFRIDRIAAQPEVLSEDAQPKPKDFNLDQYLNTHFRMVNSPVQEVTLRCQASTMDAVIDRFGTKIPVQEIVADEWFETTVEVGTGLTFYNWIFGFGGKIRIMGPDSVKAEYRERLEMAYAALDEENDQ